MIEKLTGQSVVVEKLVVKPNALPPVEEAGSNDSPGTKEPAAGNGGKPAVKPKPKRKKRPRFRAGRNARARKKAAAKAKAESQGQGYAKATS
jgi:hypothetical protein